jgi:glycosyltransferase involved in cell wall biosynthesis
VPSRPLVTVIATCFNHERFVVECLESIRAQTYPNVQLIIADDCSSDGSVALIKDWVSRTGTACTLVLHDQNQGVCRTRNETLSHALGTYVSSLSTDDTWFPEKLAVQVEQLERLPPSFGVTYGDAHLTDVDGKLLPATFFTKVRADRFFDEPPDGDVFAKLLQVNFVPAMTTMVRRECYEAVGPYDESLAYEDWDMWLRLARRYEFAFSPYVSARYRVHRSSLWHTLGSRTWESDIRILRKHLGQSPEADAIIWTRIARASYRLDQPEQLDYARASLRKHKSLKALVLYVLCRIGVPYRRVAPLERALDDFSAAARQAWTRYPRRWGRASTETSL